MFVAPKHAPQHASAVALGPTSIHITWDPPDIVDDNVIQEYRVNVTEAGTATFTQYATNHTHLIVDDLKPYHTYHCYIVAVTADEDPYTNVSVTTKEDGNLI